MDPQVQALAKATTVGRPITVINTLRSKSLMVYLRLSFWDPEGILRDFPVNFPVVPKVKAYFGDPERSQQAFNVQQGGRLTMTMSPRLEGTFFNTWTFKTLNLGFEFPQPHYIVCEPRAQVQSVRLIPQAQVAQEINTGHRAFLLPANWDLQNSDWTVRDNDGGYDAGNRIINLIRDDQRRDVGLLNLPVHLILDPHWQYLRWVYYDRLLKGPRQISILPTIAEGFIDAAAWDQNTAPDTRCNWTIAPNDDATETRQCLPWIVQTRPMPDKDVLIQFTNPANTFIESQANGTRQIVNLSNQQRDTPSVTRLSQYDLPELWQSKNYFARQQPTGDANGDFFENLDVTHIQATSNAPLTFSLDDMVLFSHNPYSVMLEMSVLAAEDRVSLFSHTFQLDNARSLGPQGLYLSGAHPQETQYPWSNVPFHRKGGDMDGYVYISRYPDWTRLVVAGGKLFDSFGRRATDLSPVLGLRAAVSWAGDFHMLQGTLRATPFFTIKPKFKQEYVSPRGSLEAGQYDFLNARWSPPPQSRVRLNQIALMDLAALRCCDEENGLEVVVVFQYLSVIFNFDQAPPVPYANVPAQMQYLEEAVQRVNLRWNGADGAYNPGPATLTDASQAPAIAGRVIWFMQAVRDDNRPRCRIDIKANNVRSHISVIFESGEWSVTAKDVAVGNDAGALVGAHESGHVASFPDEYSEKATQCSYYALPIRSNSIPGDPYNSDADAMMNGNRYVRGRYFWHLAEWLRLVCNNTPFQVRHDNKTYELPWYPGNALNGHLRTFVNWPLRAEINVHPVNGHFDAYLYALGQDEFSANVLKAGTAFDAMIIIFLKIKVRMQPLGAGTFDRLRRHLTNFTLLVGHAFNQRWAATGDFGGVTYNTCLLHIAPRFLVETITNEQDQDNISYKNLQASPSHNEAAPYNLKVTELENLHGCHLEIDIINGLDIAIPSTFNNNVLSFNVRHLAYLDRFIGQWLGLAPNNAFNFLQQPTSKQEWDNQVDDWKQQIDLNPFFGLLLANVNNIHRVP